MLLYRLDRRRARAEAFGSNANGHPNIYIDGYSSFSLSNPDSDTAHHHSDGQPYAYLHADANRYADVDQYDYTDSLRPRDLDAFGDTDLLPDAVDHSHVHPFLDSGYSNAHIHANRDVNRQPHRVPNKHRHLHPSHTLI